MSIFGSLGFLGDAGGAGASDGRIVVLAGGFTRDGNWLSDQNINSWLFGTDRTDANNIGANMKDFFNSNGWDIRSFDVSAGNTSQYGFTATLYLYNNFTALQAQQSMLSLLKEYYVGGMGFNNFFVQIVSDPYLKTGVISTIDPVEVAKAPQSTGAIVANAATKTANQIATQGVLPTAAQGLDTLLFGGQTFNIFGAKIPKLLVYGGIALVGVPMALDLVQGKRR